MQALTQLPELTTLEWEEWEEEGIEISVIENSWHEEIPEIPDIALREAIVNAVCHRDYFKKGANVMIEIFDDRVEISNPGGLPSGLDTKEFGTKSVVRNPLIASLLNRADYIEQIGTGINRDTSYFPKKGS